MPQLTNTDKMMAAATGLAVAAGIAGLLVLGQPGYALLWGSLLMALGALMLVGSRLMSHIGHLKREVRGLQRDPDVARILSLTRRAREDQVHADRMLTHAFLTQAGYRAQSDEPRVLLMSSNGAGLGHLTRLWAVERELSCETLTYTLSAGYRAMKRRADEVVYYPSADSAGLHPIEWNRGFSQHFASVVHDFKPDVVVFDGTYIYPGLTYTCRALGIRLVWLQRGCWKEQVSADSAQRRQAIDYCDAVLVPGDYGCNEAVDMGRSVEVQKVSPIVLTKYDELLPADEAKAQLGLSAEGRYVLIQLGAGTINDIESARQLAIDTVQGLGNNWQAVITQNPLSVKDVVTPGAHAVSKYPLAPFFAAFEFAIIAAGYNSVQECVAMRLPAIYVPNLQTVTDDQLSRATGCVAKGYGLLADTTASLVTCIERMGDDSVRRACLDQLAQAESALGASAAADFIVKTIDVSRTLHPHPMLFGQQRD